MTRRNIIILSLVAVFCLHSTNAAPKVYQESLNYPNQRVTFSPYYYTSKNLVYALCDKKYQAYENNCMVIHRHNVIQNETLSCNITLKIEQEDGHLGPTYEVLPFGTNKAIFTSAEIGEDTFIKLSTIQMDTCKVSETKLHVDFPYEVALYYVVPYGDSVKVIFQNKAQCGDKMCIIALDSNGKQIGNLSLISKSMNPLPFPIVAPLGAYTMDKDLFFIKPEPNNIKNLILRKPNGLERSLSKQFFVPRTTVLSMEHDLIGVCHDSLPAKTKIVCTQHDATGRLNFEFTSDEDYEQLKIRSIYNLPSGGILMVIDCADGILVIKIDSQGKMVGKFNVDDFECSRTSATAASFFEESGQYCVSMACREGNDFYIVNQSYLNIVTDCFTDADFTI